MPGVMDEKGNYHSMPNKSSSLSRTAIMKQWDKIIIHHSLTRDSETVSWGAIRRYHMIELGWLDIGYHWGIERVGDYYEILKGRSMDWNGAHTWGQNRTSIGICCVGNFDEEIPSRALIAKLDNLLAWLVSLYGISYSCIFGHRNFSPKTCPGKLFTMEEARRDYPSLLV